MGTTVRMGKESLIDQLNSIERELERIHMALIHNEGSREELASDIGCELIHIDQLRGDLENDTDTWTHRAQLELPL